MGGAPSGEQFELRHGEQLAVITEVGATLRSYRVGEREILDGFARDAMVDGGRGSVLMPWPNRLRDGRYEWEGASLQLALSEPALLNSIHGLVHWRNWSALDISPSSVLLGLRLAPMSGYPFALSLSIEYALDERGLSVSASAENIGAGACPYGVGFHPYVKVGEKVDTATLTVPASRMLTFDERQIPSGSSSVEGTAFDFRTGRQIGSALLDGCFTDLQRDGDGLARVTLAQGETAVTVWVGEACPFVMVFTGDTLAPARRRRGVAIEPMSCAPNAFASGDGLVRLEPGETHVSLWGIDPF
ncbi:MAG TPA: aldose 1-epimerase family protein [Solirubrobacteraceae bacterium]|nr:aldose 1-epimerase family protein [Solirubrobacteraceae bacterium]